MIFEPLPNAESQLPIWAKNAPAGPTQRGAVVEKNGTKMAKTLLKMARASQHTGTRSRGRGRRQQSYTYPDE